MTSRVRTAISFIAPPVSLVRFLVVGTVNTMAGLTVIWVLQELAGSGHVIANLGGYVIGVSVSFILNKRWSFSFRGAHVPAFLRFLLVFGIAYSTNLLIVVAVMSLAGSTSFWFQLCGAIPYTALFYIGCRWYVFRGSGPGEARLTAAGQ